MPSPDDTTPDWPQQATETIVEFVDNVKYKTTRPATIATRSLVYGIVIVALGIPALVILLAGLIHLLDWAIPSDVWIVYAGLGVIFSLVGLWAWRKRIA